VGNGVTAKVRCAAPTHAFSPAPALVHREAVEQAVAPVAIRSGWLQLRDMCAEFQDELFGVRSICPSSADPKVLLVQLLHVRFMFAGKARPSGVEPVSASCQFGVAPDVNIPGAIPFGDKR
jgi:hypothetical protein